MSRQTPFSFRTVMTTKDLHPLEALLRERIVVLDGAMGTMIQRYKLSEADYRGKRFRDWRGKDLKGSLELLLLTKPEVVEEIHTQYLEAGADIIETNTFSATTIGLHDFLFAGEPQSGRKNQKFFQRVVDDPDLRALVHEMNLAAAKIARGTAERVANQTGTRRFVAGSMGPLPVTASMSPDVNDPAFRAVTFDQLKQTYFDQAKALLEGDVDLLLVETIFDTLNAKAALFAVAEVFEQTGKKVPLMISGTVTDRSGRTLSGQTVEAFLISIAHAQPLIVWLNLVGGCCGTTPEHIRAIAKGARDCKPRQIQSAIHNPQSTILQLSGLEPLNITPEFGFAVIGERTNITGSPKFSKLILADDFEGALTVARQQVQNGANILDVNMDEGMIDSEATMTRFLNLIASEPEITRIPIMIDSSKWSVIEAGLKCVQGKAVVNSISLKNGEE